jgi:hypothetical protein
MWLEEATAGIGTGHESTLASLPYEKIPNDNCNDAGSMQDSSYL